MLLMPETPWGAPLMGQETIEIDGVAVPTRPFLGVYTQPLSFIGLPIVAVPLRPAGGLPIGGQIVAAPWREHHALPRAPALERQGRPNAQASPPPQPAPTSPRTARALAKPPPRSPSPPAPAPPDLSL